MFKDPEKKKQYEKQYFQNVRKLKRVRAPSDLKCLHCNEDFKRSGPNQKYCSITCSYTHRHAIKRKTDPKFKLIHTLRTRLRKAIRNKDQHMLDLLGCSYDEVKTHIEKQFQPGMSWSNHGSNGWHIDHIRALSNFGLTDPAQLKIACHYTNLQPLWAKDNLAKGNSDV